jgi:hypothetical protein
MLTIIDILALVAMSRDRRVAHMSKYFKLEQLWSNYQSAVNDNVYDRDKVQGRGMAFAAEWNRLGQDICHDFGISEDDFDYRYRHEVMKKVLDG